jgi:aspartate racemase
VLRDLAGCAVDKAAEAGINSDAPLLTLDQPQLEALERGHGVLQDIWPLTPLQEGLLFHAHYQREGADPYLVQLVLELRGRLDAARLRRALDALLVRHASLRVAFVQDSQGRPLQLVLAHCAMPWQWHDLSEVPGDERSARAAELEAVDLHQRFVLERAPLMRATLLTLGPQEHRLLLSQHHALGDGWSGRGSE